MPRITIRDWPPYSPNDQARRDNAVLAAKLMMNAAITAPVGGGIPQIEGEIVYGETEQEDLARKLEELATKKESLQHTFQFEAEMAREADAILFIGNTRAHRTPWDGECGACGGRPDCSFFYEGHVHTRGLVDTATDRIAARESGRMVPGPLCTMHAHDTGYLVGSAMLIAVRLMVDARPFMSWGVAAHKLGYCQNSALVIGIGVSTRQKNEFIDVMTNYHLINMRTGVDAIRKHVGISTLRPAGGFDYRAFNPNIDHGI